MESVLCASDYTNVVYKSKMKVKVEDKIIIYVVDPNLIPIDARQERDCEY
jgi:hypothetical protein